MKALKSTLLALVLVPAVSFANGKNCNGRTNSLSKIAELQASLCDGSSYSEFCGTLETVARQGDESAGDITNDPNTEEGRLAEAVGPATFCGETSGSLSLIKHNGILYLQGSPHTIYRNGKLKCNDSTGGVSPDKNLTDVPGVNRHKKYTFKLPPLNYNTVLKTKANLPWDPKNINSFILLELTDQSIAKNQFGQERTALTLARIPPKELSSYSRQNSVTIISRRTNYKKRKIESIENNCSITAILEHIYNMKHTCDTGQGSSGASLISGRHNNRYYSLGAHYAGIESKTTDSKDRPDQGNYFVPSDHILKTLESIVGPDLSNGSFPPPKIEST